jgi:hypothetical protein
MPHTLTLTYQPRLRVQAQQPLWRRLLAIADEASVALETLWYGLLMDAQDAVPLDALADALEGPQILEASALLDRVWTQEVEVPARRLLPPLALETVEEAATASEDSLSTLLGVPVAFIPGTLATAQGVQQSVGTEVATITTTTRRTLVRGLRAGWLADTPAPQLARQVQQVMGLTPRQAGSMARYRTHLTGQGQSASAVHRAMLRATRRALLQRARMIAATESMALINHGMQELLIQQSQAGTLDDARLRRVWRLTPGYCTVLCAPIPALNPAGVTLQQPFQTPAGPMLLPPMHPYCRCVVTVRLLPLGTV